MCTCCDALSWYRAGRVHFVTVTVPDAAVHVCWTDACRPGSPRSSVEPQRCTVCLRVSACNTFNNPDSYLCFVLRQVRFSPPRSSGLFTAHASCVTTLRMRVALSLAWCVLARDSRRLQCERGLEVLVDMRKQTSPTDTRDTGLTSQGSYHFAEVFGGVLCVKGDLGMLCSGWIWGVL